jgi:hypothetical protein
MRARQRPGFLIDSVTVSNDGEAHQEGTIMRNLSIAALALVIVALASPAVAGIIDLAIGVHGGIHVPFEEDGSTGTVLGVKLRVLPPIPMIGVEGYYNRIGQADAEEMWAQGDVNLSLDGDSFDVYGVDVLIGGVRGIPGFKWYAIVGANFTEFDEGEGDQGYRTGGQVGIGLEITPPAIGFGFEGRATLVALSWGSEPEPKFATVTVGVNYYF